MDTLRNSIKTPDYTLYIVHGFRPETDFVKKKKNHNSSLFNRDTSFCSSSIPVGVGNGQQELPLYYGDASL